MKMFKGFMPTSAKEIANMRWKSLDIIIYTADAYIDHSALLVARVGKYLISQGYRVGVVSAPELNPESFRLLGKPRLFSLVIGGEEDSILQNYTPYGKLRSSDPLQINGKKNNRPDRTVIQYTSILKSIFKNKPVIITGTEACWRRFVHYDFKDNKLRKPILLDSKADFLVYSGIELNMARIATYIKGGIEEKIKQLPGIVFLENKKPEYGLELPDFEKLVNDNSSLRDLLKLVFDNLNPYKSQLAFQKVLDRYVIFNKPFRPYSEEEMDSIFDLYYTRKAASKEAVPFLNNIDHAIMSHLGGVDFSQDRNQALKFGISLSSRSSASIFKEANYISKSRSFKNLIDNFMSEDSALYGKEITNLTSWKKDIVTKAKPDRRSIITNIFYKEDKEISKLRNNRYYKFPDYRFLKHDPSLLKDFIMNRAPGEVIFNIGNVNDRLRKYMLLPSFSEFKEFLKYFEQKCKEYGKKIVVKVDLIAGYPSETIEMAACSATILKKSNIKINRIYPFIPDPLSIGSLLYYTEQDFFNGEDLYVNKLPSYKKDLVTIYRYGNKKYLGLIKAILNRHKLDRYVNDLLYL